jgi:hypothetical protein
LNAFARRSWQRCAARKDGRIGKGNGGRSGVGAAAAGSGLKGRRVVDLGADGPDARAGFAVGEGDPWLG